MSMYADSSAPLDVTPLKAAVTGDVVTPGDAAWDDARRAWNLAADQRPALVVLTESAQDIVETVLFARSNGLRVAPQGTGHAAAALRLDDRAILLKTERLRGVSIDPDARIARAEAGVLWMEVTHPAGEHGLAALAGSSPDVGVVGYSLGGGIGWLARKYGMATNSIVAAEIVTADGVLRRIDAETDPDLFWAIRGGSGNFGVITALEFRLYPVAEVYAGALFYGPERFGEVTKAWRAWSDSLPEEVTTTVRILNFPPLPEIPEPLRGNSFTVIEATVMGDEAVGEPIVQPLRDLGPVMDTFSMIPAPALQHLHMDPEHPVPGEGDGMLLAELTDETADALMATAGPESGSSLLSVEIRQLGGALGRPAPGGGALPSIDAPYALFAVGIAMSSEMKAAAGASIDRIQEALAPWASSRNYMNFRERPADTRTFHGEWAARRLRDIKASVDPEGLFLAHHRIEA
jgi:FAD/FMN-containing dehydrogenase